MNDIRKKYINDSLIIEYSNPRIQPFNEGYYEQITKKDFMHFYYDLKILRYKELDYIGDNLVLSEKELVFETSAYDFPKVDKVPMYIDKIIKEPCILTLKDCEYNNYHKIVKYNQVMMTDSFNCEYFYKIERYDTSIKKRDEEKYKTYTNYTMSIGEGYNNVCQSANKRNGVIVYIDRLTKEELLEFKNVCLDFVNSAIEEYNNIIKSTKLKCPYCSKKFNLCGTNLKDKYNDYKYKCSNCGETIDENKWSGFWDNLSVE